MDQEIVTACQTTDVCSANPTGLIFPETADELRAAAVTGDCPAVEAILLGLTEIGVGGGKFYYDATDVQADDGVSVLNSISGGSWIKHSA